MTQAKDEDNSKAFETARWIAGHIKREQIDDDFWWETDATRWIAEALIEASEYARAEELKRCLWIIKNSDYPASDISSGKPIRKIRAIESGEGE